MRMIYQLITNTFMYVFTSFRRGGFGVVGAEAEQRLPVVVEDALGGNPLLLVTLPHVQAVDENNEQFV